MYSKEEEKNIRMAFWEGFRKYSTPKRRKQGKPRKWMMQNTGIKAIDLKFYIGSKQASVSLDVVAKSLDRRVAIWNKLLGLKRLLNEIFDQEVVWNDLFMLESGKEIIRIAVYLDDVNILRFTDALKSFSDNTQFIVITHNKRTMEAASSLYGVTMEEEGISKLVSVKFN